MAWFVRMISALVVLCAMPAQAQTYPTKPIHMLVPYAPGGITDIASRIVGAKLTEAWGQQVVVENKPGGNGFIAMTAGAKAAPDGYTLTMATVGDVAINPAMFKEMPYNVRARLCADRRRSATRRWCSPCTAPRPTRPSPMSSPPPRRSPGDSRSARRATAASTRSSLSGWRSTPTPSSSTSPTRAARRLPPRLPAATSRSGCWQARRLRRTSSPAASACWR